MTLSYFEYGIMGMGLATTPHFLSLGDLADLRGVDPNKYRVGLGCEEMAVVSPSDTVVGLMESAVSHLIRFFPFSWEEIGFVAVGTETSLDMSRPLSSFLLERYGVSGHIRSYEVKHACYGGTLAVRQAVEWLQATSSNKKALVLAVDFARYEPRHPGEPTQGAGAVALLIGKDPSLKVSTQTFPYARPAYDFYRPVGTPYPIVDGPLSLNCYMEAVEMTYRKAEEILGETLWDSLSAHTFHVPFPKMVYKAWQCLKRKISLSEKEWEDLYSSRVEPFMSLNRRIGNGYTASLWFSVAKAWDLLKKGEVFSLFSYGSGYGSELFFLKIEKKPPVEWMKEFENFLSARKRIDGETYERWRQSEKETILPLNL